MKKITTIALLAALAVLAVALVPTVAFANAGPHGGYISDTEACAGCHRAHTAPSSITWNNGTEDRSALLISTASTLEQFCLTCHDTTGQGAGTNVVDGLYYGTTYGTDNAPLISGPFGRFDPASPGAPLDGLGMAVTSSHITTGGWFAYGGGAYGTTSSVLATGGLNGGGAQIEMNCGTCHDPHGSANYRILKDEVYGVKVGGYDGSLSATDPVPTPFVISNEPGFPVAGFRLHIPNTSLGYVPNYTTALYSMAPTSAASPGAPDATRGMTGWCIGCHTVYATNASVYNAADGYGSTTRHRHPMNVPLSNFKGPRSLIATTDVNFALPLAHQTNPGAALVNEDSDWIDCMACHNAHGTTATMAGWANNASNDPLSASFGPDTGTGGVQPTGDSALLKLNNRGVCEACHNK